MLLPPYSEASSALLRVSVAFLYSFACMLSTASLFSLEFILVVMVIGHYCIELYFFL